VLGFACPVSEIGALLCVRRLCAGVGGFLFLGGGWLGSELWIQGSELGVGLFFVGVVEFLLFL
jgi:hypothetical protein